MAVHAEAFAIFADRHGLPPRRWPIAPTWMESGTGIFPDLFQRAGGLPAGLHPGEESTTTGSCRAADSSPCLACCGSSTRARRGGGPDRDRHLGPAENVAHSLRELRLAERLTRVVRSDRVARGKPFPRTSSWPAAELIRVAPAQCLAFEDAPAGWGAPPGHDRHRRHHRLLRRGLATLGTAVDLAVRDFISSSCRWRERVARGDPELARRRAKPPDRTPHAGRPRRAWAPERRPRRSGKPEKGLR